MVSLKAVLGLGLVLSICLDSAFSGSFFVISGKRVATWSGAVNGCNSLGARLAIVKSAEDHRLVRKLVHYSSNATNADRAWFGLYHDQSCSSNWRWIDQTCLSVGDFSSWKPSSSADESSNKTARYSADVSWNWSDQPVGSNASPDGMAVCETVNDDETGQAETVTTELDSDRFFIVKKAMTWQRAYSFCEHQNARLAIANTASSNAVIRELLGETKFKVTGVWLGLVAQSICSSNWVWIDETCLDVEKGSFWALNEPRNSKAGVRHGVALSRENGWKWQSVAESAELFPLCETLAFNPELQTSADMELESNSA